MSKRVRVRQLEGRVVESATIFHGDSQDGPALEICCSGGICFTFDSASAKPRATTMLGFRQKKDGDYEFGDEREWE